jgi:hypothetical protein
MGTRADFYTAKSEGIEWKGSVAFDGYSIAEADEKDLSPNDKEKRTQNFLECEIKKCSDETTFNELLSEYFKNRDDVTLPNEGWPWPWENSKLTDETYLFKDGKVWRMYRHDGEYEDCTTPCYFAAVVDKLHDDEGDIIEPSEKLVLNVPDMTHLKNVQLGKKSGLIIVSAR